MSMQLPAMPPAASTGPLQDRFGRSKQKLRISITDRCNMRCHYCMPEDPEWLPRDQILSFEELQRLAALFVRELGIRNIRVTGGEPLLRKGVTDFIAGLNELRADGLERISLTSNAILLSRYAPALKAAGLDDINISLDAMDPELFQRMTKGDLAPVLAGILAARDAGIPVKLNAVVIRDENEQEILPLTAWARSHGLPLRFIEFMPLDGKGGWRPERVVPEAEIINRLQQHYTVEPVPRTREPATYYRLDGDYQIGVISTVSNPFCASCDRVRLTATGEIFACLFSPLSTGLKESLRAGASDADLAELIRGAVWRKGKGFIESAGYVQRATTMHALGG